MNLTAEQLVPQTELDIAHRHRADTETWLAETLHGSMETHFEFGYDGQVLRGEDGGSVDKIFEDALVDADTMARQNPGMAFEKPRRLAEARELGDMHAMLHGVLPNTMITVSDYPDALKSATLDTVGYNHKRKQTMARIITLEADQKIHVRTISLDGSDRAALESIYTMMGQVPQHGELLPQRIYRDIPAQWQARLPTNIRDRYDQTMATQYGGEYHAGIRQPNDSERVNTYEFAAAQADLINEFVTQKLRDPIGAEKLRYSLAAATAERFEKYLATLNCGEAAVNVWTAQPNFSITRSIRSGLNVAQEMVMAGQRAFRQRKTFSGCGSTVEGEGGDDAFSTKNALEESGYGNKALEKAGASDKFGSLKFKCPKGHENTRPRNKLIDKCTTCGTDVTC